MHLKRFAAFELQHHRRMVLQIAPNTGKPYLRPDASIPQMIFRTNSRPQQNLRGIDRATRQDNLAPHLNCAGGAAMRKTDPVSPIASDAQITHSRAGQYSQVLASTRWLQMGDRRTATLAVANRGIKTAQPLWPVTVQIIRTALTRFVSGLQKGIDQRALVMAFGNLQRTTVAAPCIGPAV